ncbi:MAG: RDD family protein [Burkholderiales bacterium]
MASAYELLPVLAIVIAVGFAFAGILALMGIQSGRLSKAYRYALFLLCYAAVGAYFIYSWRGGQTLPMRAWRLRLVARNGGAVSMRRVLCRFAVASLAWCTAVFATIWVREHPASLAGWACLLPLAVALGWVLIDPQRQALYDRVSGTTLVTEPPRNRS